MSASAAMTAIATSARVDTVRDRGPRCQAAIAAALPAPGRNRSRYAATPTPPAAMAPLKPATKDVHPVRNAARPPKLSRRYTYSPPAWGRRAASSAYASAPASARAPPIAHTPRIAALFGSSVATKPGVVKMPTPMTFEMTMAAASSGPRRRSSGAEGRPVTRAAPLSCLRRSCAFGATTDCGDATPDSLGDQTPVDLKRTDLLPLRRSVLREQIDFRVDEL